ncbi:MAG TPA: hypothetical protein VKZ84_07115 [Bacteriovoracaceae bacterium]|nr:hypothetical protein [Bacteriovoracaceae bacterium]
MNTLSLFFIFLISTPVFADRWSPGSDPRIMKVKEYRFDELPLSADLSNTEKLWANDYWPHRKGLINKRWNTEDQKGFNTISPNKEEAFNMTYEELARLAPSEKLDLLNGNYDYPLKREVSSRAKDNDPLWWGVCNGWSPASIVHNEPTPKTLTNPDGLHIPLGSSDIKALVSYYYAYHHKVPTTNQMGRRCMTGIGPGCSNDLNAGAFHLVLTNKVGLEGTSFIADIERGRQVWNHAIIKYNSTIVNPNLSSKTGSARGTVRRVHVKTLMTVVMEIGNNSWYPTNGTDLHINAERNYEYYLELDKENNIVGGEWISRARPDFIWNMAKAETFNGQYSRISEMLND